MKYYDGYQSLDKCTKNKKILVLSRMLNILKSDIYCFSKEIDGSKWLHSFFNNKIYPKFTDFSKKCNTMKTLIYNDYVNIFNITHKENNKYTYYVNN